MCFGYPLRYQRFLLKVQVHKYVYNLARDVILAELFYLQDLLSPKSIDFSETFIQKPVVFSSQKCFDDISTRWNKQTPHRSFTLHQRMISKLTKLISNAWIVTFRIVTFFQKNPNGSKVRKSDIFSIFEQNMCRVLVVWGCRVLVVFFLSISGNGWLMNSTACIYAQKLKHFYIMKTYLCSVSSCLQFSLQVSTTIVQLFSHVWSWWCVCEWERLREDLREAQDASNYNNSNNHNKQQQ